MARKGHEMTDDATRADIVAALDLAKETIQEQLDAIAELHAENEQLREGYEKLIQWAESYPPNIFSEPHLKRVVEIVRAALAATEPTEDSHEETQGDA